MFVSSSSMRFMVDASALTTLSAMSRNRYVISRTGMVSVLYRMIEKMPKSPIPTPIPVFPFMSSSTKIMKNTRKKMAMEMSMKVK